MDRTLPQSKSDGSIGQMVAGFRVHGNARTSTGSKANNQQKKVVASLIRLTHAIQADSKFRGTPLPVYSSLDRGHPKVAPGSDG
jgi:hypothetical protein